MTYRNSFLDKLSAHDSLWEKLRKGRNPFEEQPPVSAEAEFPAGMPEGEQPETPQSLWERMGSQLRDALNVIQVGTPEAKAAREALPEQIEQKNKRWQEQAPERAKLIPGGTEFASFLETPAPEWLPKFSPMGSPIQTVGDIPKLLTEMPVLAEIGGIGKLGGKAGAVGKGIPKEPWQQTIDEFILSRKGKASEEELTAAWHSAIYQAQIQGKEVPKAIASQAEELARKVSIRPEPNAWEMSWQDWARQRQIPHKTPYDIKIAKETHKGLIKEAVSEGKPVSYQILNESGIPPVGKIVPEGKLPIPESGMTGTEARQILGREYNNKGYRDLVEQARIEAENPRLRKRPATERLAEIDKRDIVDAQAKMGQVPTAKVETPKIEAPTPKIEQPVVKPTAPVGGEPPVPPKPTEVSAPPPSELPKVPKTELPVEPRAATLEGMDLPNQLRTVHREVFVDVDTLKQSLKGLGKDPDTRLRRLILKNTESQLAKADSLVREVESGVKVADDTISTLRDRLLKSKESLTALRTTGQSIEGMKKAAADFMEAILPTAERGKFLRSLKNIKTEKDMSVVLTRAEELATKVDKKAIIGDIAKIDTSEMLEPFKSKIQSILKDFDTEYRSGQFIEKSERTREYIARLVNEGVPVNMPDELLDTLFKTRLQDMTTEQMAILRDELQGLVKQSKLKGKLISIQADRRVDSAVKELSEHLGKPEPLREPITAESLKKTFWQGAKEKVGSVVSRFNRVERMLYKLDNLDDNGKMWKFFYEPIDKATNIKTKSIYTTMDTFRGILKQKGIDLAETLKGTTKIGDSMLTPSERMGVYLHSLNEDNLLHLKFGNKFGDDMIKQVVDGLTPQEKAIADWIHDYFVKTGPEINKVRQYVEGKSLGIVEDYFPIIINWDAYADLNVGKQIAQEMAQRFQSKWASSGIAKQFLKERSHRAMQPIRLDAMSIFVDRLEAFEHYKNFAPVVRDLQLVAKNPEFRQALVGRGGKKADEILSKWLTDVAQTNPLRVTSQAEGVLRQMRVNSTHAILGLNITSALKQPVSFFTGMAEIGELPALKGLFTYLRHPIETKALIKEYAPQIYNRIWMSGGFEREIAEAKMLRDVASRVTGKLSNKEVFTYLNRTTDKVAVAGMWRGAFEDALTKMPAQEAADYATKAVRKTQSFFEVKDLPEYYRSGEAAKMLTIFTNETNNLWQLMQHEWVGKTMAGKQSPIQLARKLFEGVVIPSLLIGWISRSRPAQDAKDFGIDVGNQLLSMIPIVGNLVGLGYKNYYGGTNMVTTQMLDRFNQIVSQVEGGKWLQAGLGVPELAGYAAGVPVVQPKRTIQGIIDLATKKSDDWMRLIYSESAREKGLTPKDKVVRALKEVYPKLGQPDIEGLQKKIEKATTPEMKEYLQKKGAIFDVGDLGSKIDPRIEDMSIDDIKKANLPSIVSGRKRALELFKIYANTVPDKREALRHKNPELDAMLFFWGRVEAVKTAEAMRIVRQMMADYGIPESAIPGLNKKSTSTTLPSLPSMNRKSTMPSPLQQYRERRSTMPSPLRGFTR